MTSTPRASALAQPGLRPFWAGQALSQLGFQFEGLAMPVLAVTMLHATEADMGYLNAANTAAFLLVGLVAGAWWIAGASAASSSSPTSPAPSW